MSYLVMLIKLRLMNARVHSVAMQIEYVVASWAVSVANLAMFCQRTSIT